MILMKSGIFTGSSGHALLYAFSFQHFFRVLVFQSGERSSCVPGSQQILSLHVLLLRLNVVQSDTDVCHEAMKRKCILRA